MSENQGAEAFQHVEGNTASTVMVRGKWTLRSRRTQPHVRTLSRRDLGASMFLGKVFVRVREGVSRVCPHAIWRSVFPVSVLCDREDAQVLIPEA